jgi:hypothetical protein
MFDQTMLLTLLLAPVLAYVAGALLFSVYELTQQDQALAILLLCISPSSWFI